MASTTPAGDVIAEQIAYYDAIAETYVKWANMSVGDDDARASAALEAMVPAGHVLEIGCGPRIWTEKLALRARRDTATDAFPQMLPSSARGSTRRTSSCSWRTCSAGSPRRATTP
jgi:ubiquinone/menaquinone biosynthesis C-methylase UbiE